jgi:hypothetical protein
LTMTLTDDGVTLSYKYQGKLPSVARNSLSSLFSYDVNGNCFK